MNNLINLNKHEEFLDHLKFSLDEDIRKQTLLKEEQVKIENLKLFLNNKVLKEKSLKMNFNIGSGIYYDAEIELNGKIILNIGSDVYLEMQYEEAIKYISKKFEINRKKIDILNQQIIKNKTYIRLTLSLINQIKNN